MYIFLNVYLQQCLMYLIPMPLLHLLHDSTLQTYFHQDLFTERVRYVNLSYIFYYFSLTIFSSLIFLPLISLRIFAFANLRFESIGFCLTVIYIVHIVSYCGLLGRLVPQCIVKNECRRLGNPHEELKLRIYYQISYCANTDYQDRFRRKYVRLSARYCKQ